MSSHPIFETVRQHLQQGETGAALQAMITFLETEDKQGERLHTLRVVQANYNAARQQELKGILAFQEAQREYSKVNDALLSTIAELTTGRSSHTVAPPGATRYRMPIVLGGAGLLLAIIAAALFFSRSETASPAAALSSVTAPGRDRPCCLEGTAQ